MQLVHQGMSDEEAVENAIKTLEFGKKKVAVRLTDVCVLDKHLNILKSCEYGSRSGHFRSIMNDADYSFVNRLNFFL